MSGGMHGTQMLRRRRHFAKGEPSWFGESRYEVIDIRASTAVLKNDSQPVRGVTSGEVSKDGTILAKLAGVGPGFGVQLRGDGIRRFLLAKIKDFMTMLHSLRGDQLVGGDWSRHAQASLARP